MRNLPNPPWRYSKLKTRAEELEKCLNEGLEPTYYFNIFRHHHAQNTILRHYHCTTTCGLPLRPMYMVRDV